MKAFFEYMALCESHEVTFATLDDCFLGWARWAIDAHEIYTDEEQAEACIVRAEKAGDNFKLRSMPVLSFRTYINGLAFVHKAFAHSQSIVVISSSQFPKLRDFLAPILTRALDRKAANWKGIVCVPVVV